MTEHCLTKHQVVLAFALGALGIIILSATCLFLKLSAPANDENSPSHRRLANSLRVRLATFKKRVWTERTTSTSLEDLEDTNGIWHRTLEAVLTSLGFSQLITGFALFVSFKVTYGNSIEDNHALLAGFMCLTSVCCQTMIPWVVRRQDTKIAFRGAVSLLLLLMYSITQLAAGPTNLPIALPSIVFALWAIFSFWRIYRAHQSTGVVSSPWIRAHSKPFYEVVYFSLTAAGSMFMITLTLTWKFEFSRQTKNYSCSLNSVAENRWTLGQILAVVMFGSTIFSVVEAFLGMSGSCSPLNVDC